MSDYKSKIKKAEDEIQTADHLIYVTSPLIKDKDLLLSAFDHIYKSFQNAIHSYLLYKRERKEIMSIPNSEKLRIETFLEEFGEEFGIEKGEWQDYLNLERVWRRKEKGQFSFRRDNSLHLVLNDFNTVSVGTEEIKNDLLMIKDLINKIKGKCQGRP